MPTRRCGHARHEAIADLRTRGHGRQRRFPAIRRFGRRELRQRHRRRVPRRAERRLVRRAGDSGEEFVAVFRDAVPEVQSRCDHLVRRSSTIWLRRLAAEHARQEQHYRDIIARSAQEKQRAAERAKLQQRHLTLTKARHGTGGLVRKRKKLEDAHRQMNTRAVGVCAIGASSCARRSPSGCPSALAPTIRVSVTQAGDRSATRRC